MKRWRTRGIPAGVKNGMVRTRWSELGVGERLATVRKSHRHCGPHLRLVLRVDLGPVLTAVVLSVWCRVSRVAPCSVACARAHDARLRYILYLTRAFERRLRFVRREHERNLLAT